MMAARLLVAAALLPGAPHASQWTCPVTTPMRTRSPANSPSPLLPSLLPLPPAAAPLQPSPLLVCLQRLLPPALNSPLAALAALLETMLDRKRLLVLATLLTGREEKYDALLAWLGPLDSLAATIAATAAGAAAAGAPAIGELSVALGASILALAGTAPGV